MDKTRGWDYMCLALYAFAGLGIEALLAFLIEPFLYGGALSEWSVLQNIAHWVITCILWGVVIFLLIKEAKCKYGFDLFENETVSVDRCGRMSDIYIVRVIY